jgi:hypothetical protein
LTGFSGLRWSSFPAPFGTRLRKWHEFHSYNGIRQSEDWTYSIPITRKALLSVMEGPIYRLIKIKEPAKFHLDQRAVVYIGGKDALQVWPSDVMFKYLRERIGNLREIYVPNGDHMLAGCEEEVIRKIVQWASPGVNS